MRQLIQFVRENRVLIGLYGGLFTILGIALFWRIGSLVPGYAQVEVDALANGVSWQAIMDNPVNAPFLVVEKLLTYLHPNLLTTRLAAALLSTLVLVAFCLLVKRWYGHRTALISTLLFGVSCGFLHVARLGTPEVLLFGLFILAVMGYRMERTAGAGVVSIAVLTATALLYVPGMFWFILLGIFWQWKTIDQILKRHTITSALVSLLVVIGIMPLAWAVYHNHNILWSILAMPAAWPDVIAVLKNIAFAPFHLFVFNHDTNAARWLNDAPLLDAFSLAMFVFGSYVLLRRRGDPRKPLFITFLLLSFVLTGLNNGVTFAVILPFIYLIAAGGIHNFTGHWFRTFPRNPIARGLGWGAIGVVVGLACSYHIWHYFVGWPQARATHGAFSIKE